MMGFLNETYSLAYFAILGELLPGLSSTLSFFKTFGFLSLLLGFFKGDCFKSDSSFFLCYLSTNWNNRTKRICLVFLTNTA